MFFRFGDLLAEGDMRFGKGRPVDCPLPEIIITGDEASLNHLPEPFFLSLFKIILDPQPLGQAAADIQGGSRLVKRFHNPLHHTTGRYGPSDAQVVPFHEGIDGKQNVGKPGGGGHNLFRRTDEGHFPEALHHFIGIGVLIDGVGLHDEEHPDVGRVSPFLSLEQGVGRF